VRFIYLDTCGYIYHLENHPTFAAKLEIFFNEIDLGKSLFVASPLILQEIMTGVYSRSDPNWESVYSLLVTHPGIRWTNYTLKIADLAAQIRSQWNLKTPDSIHVATALYSKCNLFITNDKELKLKMKEAQIQVTLIQ